MATDVVMPQMGESIAEGTVVRWIKKVGDTVDRDEPLFEISTDKVDAEIPSPAAGVVSEIRVKEGETVPVNSVVAVIGSGVAAPAKAVEPTVPTAKAAEPPKASAQADGAAAAPPPPPHYHDRDEPAVRASRSTRACRSIHSTTGAGRGTSRCKRLDRRCHSRALVAAGAQDREGAQRRHRADSRHGDRRPRDEGRHPRIHRQGFGGQAGRAG